MIKNLLVGPVWKKEGCMCVHVYSGITSRCISLIQAYYLAKRNNISNLIIIWQLEKWCNIKYADVFDKNQFKDINLTVMNYKFFPPNWGEGVKEYVRKGQIGKVFYCLGQWILYFARKIYNCKAESLMDYFKAKDTYVRYDPETEIGWSGKAYEDWLTSCWNRIKGYLKEKVNFCAGIYCGLIRGEEESMSLSNPSVLLFQEKYNTIVDSIVLRGGGYMDWRACQADGSQG